MALVSSLKLELANTSPNPHPPSILIPYSGACHPHLSSVAVRVTGLQSTVGLQLGAIYMIQIRMIAQ